MHDAIPPSLIDLLRERESCLVTVWDCEQRIRRLLGGADYPFPPPPDLPSRGRSKGSREAAAAPGPRRLRDGENAYRVAAHFAGETRVLVHHDFEVVKTLGATAAPYFQVTTIEPVRLRADGTPEEPPGLPTDAAPPPGAAAVDAAASGDCADPTGQRLVV